jgi:hypothetical protein
MPYKRPYSKEVKENIKLDKRKRREKAKNENICSNCLSRQKAEGKARCLQCIEERKKWFDNKKIEVKKNGICYICFNRKASGGFFSCSKCRKIKKQRRKDFKKNGICQTCNSKKTRKGKTTCQSCQNYTKNNSRKQRLKLIEFLGGKCRHCGFDDPRALQVDHVNGGGRKERFNYDNQCQYRKIIKDDKTGKYQLLCANCNWIKRFEKKEHN